MRLTKNKIAILETLAAVDDWSCIEYGPPPRNAATAAMMLGRADHRPVARTLRLMEQQGLVVAEILPVDVWCGIRRNHYPQQLKCYWPADGEAGRGAKAWEQFDRMLRAAHNSSG